MDFAEQLRTLANLFAELGEECKIPSPFLVDKFVNGLGPNFDIFTTAFFQTRSLISIKEDTELGIKSVTAVTLDDVVLAANIEEQKQKSQGETKSAFLSHTETTSKYPVNPANPAERLMSVAYCGHCDKIGHSEKKCFILHTELRKRPGDDKKRKGKDKRTKDLREKAAESMATLAAEEPTVLMAFSGDKTQTPQTLDLDSFAFVADTNGFMAAQVHSDVDSLAGLFVLDTGCSQHCSCREDLFTDLRPYHGKPIRGIGDIKVVPKAIGTLTVAVKIKDCKLDFRLYNALLCPNLGATLISVQQILQIGGEIHFNKDTASIIHPQYTLYALLRHGLFLLDLCVEM